MMNELFPSYYNGARSHRWPHNENQPPHSKRPLMLPSPSTIASHFLSLILEIPILLWPWWWWLLLCTRYRLSQTIMYFLKRKDKKNRNWDLETMKVLHESRYPKQRKQFFLKYMLFQVSQYKQVHKKEPQRMYKCMYITIWAHALVLRTRHIYTWRA